MACECGSHPGRMHINAEMVYIEPLTENVNSEEPVKFLVTDLTNYGLPFIRYQIEDLGIFSNETCECGRGLPVFRMEAGRASDFLISPCDKSRVSGCSFLHHLIAEGPEVGQIQVVQDRINHLTLRIVKSSGFQPDKLAHFDRVIERIFKGKMHYDLEYVVKIEREKSKKYFFTKCLITKDETL
jgi:phenylacetate-CoA ligase